jgi:hypothetical protein
MLKVDLSESGEDRFKQAIDALLAAAYDPITFPASWLTDGNKLSPMAYDRLYAITKAAIAAVPGGSDEAAALAFLSAASIKRSTISN